MERQFFAQVDDNNIVTKVAVVTREFLEANPDRYTGKWVETFFNTEGKVYAGIGYIYDAVNDVFVAPQAPETGENNENQSTTKSSTTVIFP